MTKNTKRGILILLVMLCITFAFVLGCGQIEVPGGIGPGDGGDGNNPGGTGGNATQLSSVDASSVTCSQEESSFWVSWTGVDNAKSYEVRCGAATLTAQTARVDLATSSKFTMPTSGQKIVIIIIAKADGYTDSRPTSVVYSDGEVGGNTGGDALSSVNADGITCNKSGDSFWVYWEKVEGATSYEVICGSVTLTTAGTSVDLATSSKFTMPTRGKKIIISIIAKGDGYSDSLPTSITYEEGKQVRSLEIISFANGIITWKEDSRAQKYIVKVDGNVAAESTSNTYNTSSLSGNARIDITATNATSSTTLSFMYIAATRKLKALPINDITVDGEILRWSAVSGASGYKIVDLDFNSYEVSTTHYIMSIRNVVYCVYPVMPADSVIESAEIEQMDIKYLDGSGTESDPYLIKTPFDLRAVDYYELIAFENGGTKKNYYKIENDINYNAVSALEGDSNMFTLKKPFYGVLDGNGKTLSNISVHYNYGFWAMFEHIAPSGTVKNIKFDSATIVSSVIDDTHPINASVAMVAYRNYGTVSSVTLGGNSKLTAKGGCVAGLVVHNFGTVTGCTVNKCDLKQENTSSMGAAAYEMAGVVLENYGTVSGNNVTTLNISGVGSNIGSSAGIVAINRTGATVKDNSFNGVTIKNLKSTKEAGGVVGYCAKGGTVTKGTGDLGTLIVGSSTVSGETGTSATPHGKLCGKKD